MTLSEQAILQTSATSATDDLIIAITSQILGRPKGSRVTLDIPDMLSLITRIRAADEELLSYKLNQSVWQVIDTAPKDGTAVLGVTSYGNQIVAYYNEARGRYVNLGGGANQPLTHWMPLPSPPASAMVPALPPKITGGE